MQRGGRNRQLFGQGARAAAAYPDFLPVLADMLVASAAPTARAVTKHGVTHDTATQPGGVHAVPDGRHPARPLMPEPQRVGGVALVEVRHLPGEELDVGAADPHPLHVNDRLARNGNRHRHLLDRTLFRTGEDIRPHRSRADN